MNLSRALFVLFCLSCNAVCGLVFGQGTDDSVSLPKKPVTVDLPLQGGKDLFPGGAIPAIAEAQKLPDLFSPRGRRFSYTTFPWKREIQTTVFWVGEKPTPGNPVPNTASSWDPKWSERFGGYDDPDPEERSGYLPKGFTPEQNPFYVALPYNDLKGMETKDSARKHIPWFQETFYRNGKSVLKGRWVAIRRGAKVCYGQWEDCGPFETDDWRYVFKDARPNTTGNGGAGLDVSPAIRDYLEFRYSTTCDWRFVELHEVPDGPWKKWGANNPFALRPDGNTPDKNSVVASISKLHELKKKISGEKQGRER